MNDRFYKLLNAQPEEDAPKAKKETTIEKICRCLEMPPPDGEDWYDQWTVINDLSSALASSAPLKIDINQYTQPNTDTTEWWTINTDSQTYSDNKTYGNGIVLKPISEDVAILTDTNRTDRYEDSSDSESVIRDINKIKDYFDTESLTIKTPKYQYSSCGTTN